MQTFTHRGLTVAYHDRGAGSAVVMLHNGGTSSTIWRYQGEALEGHHRVIAVDLPGFGASPRPTRPAELAAMVELIDALIEELDLAPALLVGNCMGSNIAVSLARRNPDVVSGILAVNPLTAASFSAGRLGLLHHMQRVAPRPTAALRSVARRFRAPHTAAALALRFQLGAKGVARHLHEDPELMACQLRADQLPALVDVLDDLNAYGALDNPNADGAVDSTDGEGRDLPIWIVWGASNRVLSHRGGAHLAQRLRAERVEVIDGCGHLPMLEDPDALNSLLVELIDATNPTQNTATQRTARG
jgi:pimeloyl-ACP methyl ester carboxylesterase